MRRWSKALCQHLGGRGYCQDLRQSPHDWQRSSQVRALNQRVWRCVQEWTGEGHGSGCLDTERLLAVVLVMIRALLPLELRANPSASLRRLILLIFCHWLAPALCGARLAAASGQ